MSSNSRWTLLPATLLAATTLGAVALAEPVEPLPSPAPDSTEKKPAAAEPTAPPSEIEPPPDAPPPAETTESAAEEDGRKIHLVAPPPSRGDSRTYHRHDGFYLRTSLGLSLLWANIDDEGAQDADFDVSGTAMAIDLLIGGSPTPGIAIGGGLVGNWAFGAEFERRGDPTENRAYQDGTLGVFVDGFPSDTGPWHFGGLLGLSGVNVQQDATVQKTGGLGGAIWAGYDQWVAPDWALGGEMRLTMNQTSGEENGFNVSSGGWTLGLMFSALYH